MRLLIADDHPVVLAGIRQTLEQEADFDVVGVAESGPAVLESVERLVPDVLLLDLRLPGVDGFGCLRSIQDHHPELKVVVLSVIADPEQIQAAFECGACGFVLKTIDPSDLASAIRQAIEQTAYHALGLPALDETAETEPGGLTAREATVMKAVARGLSNQAIGKELWVTEQTIKFHLTNIYRKLGVASCTEAVCRAFANGLADQPAVSLAPSRTTADEAREESYPYEPHLS
jgi:DNA-binding NarL/FixJ family response regulator